MQKRTKIEPLCMPDQSIKEIPGLVHEVTVSKEELTWKELAWLLDKFFVVVFMVAITVSTAAFIVIISLKISKY